MKGGLRELALFAGAGGGILGGKLLGWRTVCAVEYASFPRQVLLARQRDGMLDRFPIWDDVRTFDGKPWRGLVDVISGGFPCQDISAAGKGAGITGERSGLWKEMARIIGEVRPRYAFVENSPMLVSRGLGLVLADLAALGYDAKWGIVSAADCGAPHRRNRIWIRCTDPKQELADTLLCGCNDGRAEVNATKTGINAQRNTIASSNDVSDTKGFHAQGFKTKQGEIKSRGSSWWKAEPELGRVAYGVADWVDRLKAIGNGQVPIVAATAWSILNE